MCWRCFINVLDGLIVTLLALIVLCVTSKPAYGYVDPGSGLLLLQILGSTFAGAVFLARQRIRQWFHIGTESKKAGTRSDHD